VSERSVLQVLQPRDGGVAEHVLRVSRGLSARGWRVHVALSPGSSIAEPLAADGVVVHEVEMRREPGLGDLGAARALRRLDDSASYDLIHAHSSKAGALVRGALPRRSRLVYTPHCFAFAAPFGRAQRFAYRAVEQALLPRSAAVIAVCEWERRLALSELRGASGRTHVIHNGVAPSEAQAPAELLEFKGGLPLAGLISVLRPQKDPLSAVRAVTRLPVEAGRLAIVGNGELANAVESEIERLGLSEQVRLFPFEHEVGAYLAGLDVMVLSSSWEAFPLSVLEAMASSTAVVATDVGGVGEAVIDGETGRLVPQGSPDRLGQALGELLGDAGLRERLGARGRQIYDSRFRVDPMVDRVAALYEELLRR